MKTNLEDLRERLRGGLFLSSMMNVTNGSFCSERSDGCSMVQIGGYLAEPSAYGTMKSVLPPNKQDCIKFFVEECRKARSRHPDLIVCLNMATLKLKWGLETTRSFYEAGGDIVELNIHGGLERYHNLGRLRAMVLSENRHELFRWLKELVKLETPIIVKFREGVISDYMVILEKLVDLDLFRVHFNIRDATILKPNLRFVRTIAGRYPLFLLVSGYVRSAEEALELFKAGADMIGIADPTRSDPNFIRKIAEELARRSLD